MTTLEQIRALAAQGVGHPGTEAIIGRKLVQTIERGANGEMVEVKA